MGQIRSTHPAGRKPSCRQNTFVCKQGNFSWLLRLHSSLQSVSLISSNVQILIEGDWAVNPCKSGSRHQTRRARHCERHDYHLLEVDTYPNQVRCLVSLQAAQNISKVIQTLKANSTRECVRQLGWVAPVWAGGYLARSVGKMRIGAVRQYLKQQSEHHVYETRLRPPVYRYRASAPVSLTDCVSKALVGGGSDLNESPNCRLGAAYPKRFET